MYNSINKYIVFPLYLQLANNKLLGRLNQLEKSQYYSRDKINALQFERLKKLLIHCKNNVEFYRDRFNKIGFIPEDIKDIRDINVIPCLTKEDIQNNIDTLVAANMNKNNLMADASGGSTGKPTNFYKDLPRHHLRAADQFRHDRWCGWDIGEKIVTLWGAQREFERCPSLKARFVEKYVYRTFRFNAFDISERNVLAYVESLKMIKPKMIIAYANVALLFANIIHEHKVNMNNNHIKGLISSAETLTEVNRDIIESAFKCKVFNRYGSREVGLVASECSEKNGLHINSENVFVEVQNNGVEARPGESGELIVTDLWNYGMPFVRYQMGDIGVKTDRICTCGRGLPMLEKIHGRISDFLVDSHGKMVHGEYFTHLFYGVNGIEQFQIIQEESGKIVINILPNNYFIENNMKSIINKIKLCLGANTVITVNLVNKSLIESSGKFRFTISRIPNKYNSEYGAS